MSDSLNEILLNGTMIASLYGKSLVEEPQIRSNPAAIRYLGNNASKITILVRSPNHAFLPEEELSFLHKMLGACNLNSGDVAIVNLASYPLSPEDITTQTDPRKMILFGVSDNKNQFEITIEGNIERLNAPPISDLMGESPQSRQQKSKLWTSLKQLFRL